MAERSEQVTWVPPIARAERPRCLKPCAKTWNGTECLRERGHKGKHRDFTHPDCLMGHEMTLRGTTYSCSAKGDHYAASMSRAAFIAAGGCHGCEPPGMTYVGCPLRSPDENGPSGVAS